MKLAKNQVKAKQLFENYSLSSSMSSPISNLRCSKECGKTKCVCFNEIIWLIIMKIRLEIKKRSHRYDLNRTRSKNGY